MRKRTSSDVLWCPLSDLMNNQSCRVMATFNTIIELIIIMTNRFILRIANFLLSWARSEQQQQH